MRAVLNENDFAEMLSSEKAILFVLVDWSEYAKIGGELLEAAEARFIHGFQSGPLSWWVGDLSSTNSSMSPVIRQWLAKQDHPVEHGLFPHIAMGNGSVVWIIRGEIVSFASSVMRLGLEGLLTRTEKLFGVGYQSKS